MAPEMALESGEVDRRSDIYSLGCVAYWLTTGQLVFEGNTPIAKVVQHIQSVPVPPSEKSELEIPKPLEEIILACLEKSPDARPQNIAELDRLLADCITGRRWDNEKAGEWWDLHRPI
jgi:serine/threonine-protein kinase